MNKQEISIEEVRKCMVLVQQGFSGYMAMNATTKEIRKLDRAQETHGSSER